MREERPELVLYRFFNAAGELLYVGKSVQAWERFAQHRRGSVFYPEAASVSLQRGFDNEDALTAAETEAIRSEHPRFNIDQNDGVRRPPRRARNPESMRRALPINRRVAKSGTVTYWFQIDVGMKPDGSRNRRSFTYGTWGEARREYRRMKAAPRM